MRLKKTPLRGDSLLMSHTRKRKGSSYLILGGDEGIDFVCRICGDHRRVISGRHLSKHDTDRETYMEQYYLTPDELIAKDFRTLSRMHRSKESLAYGRIRREKSALLSAAQVYFGNWGRALYAARIDPILYFVHHKWRKRRIGSSSGAGAKGKRQSRTHITTP